MKRFRSTSNLYFKLRSRSPSDKRACNFCIDASSRSRQILQMWTELLPSSYSPDTPLDKSLSSPHLFLQFVMTQLLAALRSEGITNHLCREPFDRNVSWKLMDIFTQRLSKHEIKPHRDVMFAGFFMLEHLMHRGASRLSFPGDRPPPHQFDLPGLRNNIEWCSQSDYGRDFMSEWVIATAACNSSHAAHSREGAQKLLYGKHEFTKSAYR